MKEMKKLYSFVLPKVEEVEEPSKEKDPQTNEEITVLRKVKKSVNKEFFIRLPNRRLADEADQFYSIEFSKNVKNGILTRIQLAKKFDDDGGIFSKKEQLHQKKLTDQLIALYAEKEKIQDSKKKEDKKRLKDIEAEINVINESLTDYQIAVNNLYKETAEFKARNRTILWWMLFLSCAKDGENEIEIFKPKNAEDGADNFDARLNVYDSLEEDSDSFMNDVMRYFIGLISFWFVGETNSKDEFDELFRKLKNDIDKIK